MRNMNEELYCKLLPLAKQIEDTYKHVWFLPDTKLMQVCHDLKIKEVSKDGIWYRITLFSEEFGWIPVDKSYDPEYKRRDELQSAGLMLPTVEEFLRYVSWVDHVVSGLEYPKDFTNETL